MYLQANVKLGQTTVINGIAYDLSWFASASPTQLAALGVSYAPDPVPPDPTQYTWTVNPDGSLNITPLSPGDATFIKNQHKAENIASMLAAAHSTEDAELSGTFAADIVAMGVLLGGPKSLAVQAWSESIWALYASRLPTIYPTYDPANDDFSDCGDVPYPIEELIAEVGYALSKPLDALSFPTITGEVLTLDLSIANNFKTTLNDNVTSFIISNVSSFSISQGFTLTFVADGTQRTVAWPGTFKWPNNVQPTLTSTLNKTDVFAFMSHDNGTTWLAFIPGQNL